MEYVINIDSYICSTEQINLETVFEYETQQEKYLSTTVEVLNFSKWDN